MLRQGLALIVLSSLALAGGCASARPSGFSSSPASSVLGTASVETQDPRLAAALLKAMVQRTPENLTAVADRYADLHVMDTALDYYSAARDVDARHAPAYNGSARAWRDSGLLERALADAHRATFFAPHSPEAWNTLGTIFQDLGLEEQATSAYRRAAVLDPKAAYPRSNLCYLALLAGRTAEARDECRAALEADGGFTAARNNLALIDALAGDTVSAFDVFSEAAGEAAAHYNLGMVLLTHGHYQDAVAAFEAAYRAEPEFEKAHQRARLARKRALGSKETTDAGR